MTTGAFKAGSAYIELTADSTNFDRSMKGSFKRSAGKAGDKAGDAFVDSFAAEKRGWAIGDSLKRGVGTALKGGLIAGSALAGAATGLSLVVKKSLAAASEIKQLSDVAGISSERFQEMAYGARQFGVDGRDMSDLLKDMNDRMGDYLQTGAGPLADFFENIAPKVGLTADAFAGLSSDQALGKYIKALEDAGVNQQEMTFYMEALAGNSSRLIPLLRNNGAEMNRLSSEARALGVVLDEGVVNNAAEADKKLQSLGETLKTGVTAEIVKAAPQIQEITEGLIALTPTLVDWAGAAIGGLSNLGNSIEDLSDKWNASIFGSGNARGMPTSENGLKERLNDLAKLNELNSSGANITGFKRAFAPADLKKDAVLFNEIAISIFGKESVSEMRKSGADFRSAILEEYNKTADSLKGIQSTTPIQPATGGFNFGSGAGSTITPKAIKAETDAQRARNEALKDAMRLYEQTRTPLEEYRLALAALAAVEADAGLADAAGGAETFGRARIQALEDLANATGNYELAVEQLGAAIGSGALSPEQGAKAMERIRQSLDIEQQRIDAVQEAAAVEQEALITKNDLLLDEADIRLKLASLSGNPAEIEKIQREIELLREKGTLLRQGASDSDASAIAGGRVAQFNMAELEGNARDAFKSGFRDAVENGPWSALKSKLSSVTDKMFDNALDTLFDAISGGLSGGGGGFGGIISSFLGFSSGGYTGDGNASDIAGVVHKKEFVLKASATANPKNRAIAERMNKGLPIDLSSPAIALPSSSNRGPTGETSISVNIDATGADAAALARVQAEISGLTQTLPQRVQEIQRDQRIGAI